VRDVGGRDEQHLAQIERHVQIVVGEGRVLRGVEHLEQRRRGIALEGDPELVDLVEQKYRIFRSALAHSLDDAPGHGADVRAPMAANVGLVTSAAQ
jgi:hypothetical protein